MRLPIRYFTFAIGLLVTISVVTLMSKRATAQPNFFGQASPVGSWYGKAIADDPAHAPFPAIWMMPTIFADGNVIASDSHELNTPHTTAHGNWEWTGPNSLHAVFVFINVGLVPDGLTGTFRVSFEIGRAHV